MTFEELLEKYQALLLENDSLKQEIKNLNTKLGVLEHWAITDGMPAWKNCNRKERVW